MIAGPAFFRSGADASGSGWSTTDKDAGILLSSFGTLAERNSGSSNQEAVRGTQSRNAGARYFEIVIVNASALTDVAAGIGDGDAPLYAGSISVFGTYSVWRVTNGQVFNGTTYYGVLDALSAGDTIGVIADITNGRVWYSKNGTVVSGNPTAGTGAQWNFGGSIALYPYAMFEHTSIQLELKTASFNFAPPLGFIAWE